MLFFMKPIQIWENNLEGIINVRFSKEPSKLFYVWYLISILFFNFEFVFCNLILTVLAVRFTRWFKWKKKEIYMLD